MALAEFFTIQKFTTLISCSQHFMKIYEFLYIRTYVVPVMQLLCTIAIFTINLWVSCVQDLANIALNS